MHSIRREWAIGRPASAIGAGPGVDAGVLIGTWLGLPPVPAFLLCSAPNHFHDVSEVTSSRRHRRFFSVPSLIEQFLQSLSRLFLTP